MFVRTRRSQRGLLCQVPGILPSPVTLSVCNAVKAPMPLGMMDGTFGNVSSLIKDIIND